MQDVGTFKDANILQDVQVVVLAAGKGTRMKDETKPKVLHKLVGKTLLDRVLDTCILLGVQGKPVVVVGYMREMIMEHLGDKVDYAVQEDQLGTADAVKTALPFVHSKQVLVLSGDMPLIRPETLTSFIAQHVEKKCVMSLISTEVPDFDDKFVSLHKFGRIIKDNEGSILGIQEYKDASDEQREIREVNAGLYVFDVEWLKIALPLVGTQNAQKEFYLTDLLQLAVEHGLGVSVYKVNPGEVLGVNSKEDLKVASLFLQAASQDPFLNLVY